MSVNKFNYREARDIVNNIYALEDILNNIDRDAEAKKSNIIINIEVTDGKNGWPSTYRIPIEQNHRIYECLHELYQNIVDDKYEELNSL